jgi:hypothetical protein
MRARARAHTHMYILTSPLFSQLHNISTKSFVKLLSKGVIFRLVQRSSLRSELSHDIYISQLHIPGEPSVLAYNHGDAVGEWTTSDANGKHEQGL